MTCCAPKLCDCLVCRNARHREAVWVRHEAGQDYPGIRARIMERVNERLDPDWTRLAP
jgi:hypothetical protein